MMRATKKRCLMLSWMLAQVERLDDSEFSLSVSLKLLRSLTTLRQIERLPAYLRSLRDEGDRDSFDRFIKLWLATASAYHGSCPSPAEGYRYWSARMLQLQKQLSQTPISLCDPYYIKVGLTGWDMARLQLLSRVAFDCGLISNREMWDNQIFAWKLAASTLNNWADLGFSCMLGYALHADSIPLGELYKSYQIATESPESPWFSTRFK